MKPSSEVSSPVEEAPIAEDAPAAASASAPGLPSTFGARGQTADQRAASLGSSSSLRNSGSPVGTAEGALTPGDIEPYIPNESDDPSTVERAPLIDYSNYDFGSKITEWEKPMPNIDFIFHNKMPKCGSSTMNNILIVLARTNRFYYQKLNPHNLPRDQLTSERPLVDYVRNNVTATPFVLLKHHFPFNFEKYWAFGGQQSKNTCSDL